MRENLGRPTDILRRTFRIRCHADLKGRGYRQSDQAFAQILDKLDSALRSSPSTYMEAQLDDFFASIRLGCLSDANPKGETYGL
jgi:hypothetical protein